MAKWTIRDNIIFNKDVTRKGDKYYWKGNRIPKSLLDTLWESLGLK